MEEFVAVLRAVSMLYSRVHVSDLYYVYLKKIAEWSLTSQNVCCESAISHLMKAYVALNCSQCIVFVWYATVAWRVVGADESSVWHTSPSHSIKWLIIGNDLWPLFKPPWSYPRSKFRRFAPTCLAMAPMKTMKAMKAMKILFVHFMFFRSSRHHMGSGSSEPSDS